MASDHSNGPFRGRAYLVWSDVYGGRCEVFVAYSDDKGMTWSVAVRASDQPWPQEQQIPERQMPSIAVNERGVVGIAWYDSRESLNREYRLRFTASGDGGENWLPSVPISTYSFVVRNPPDFAAHATATGGGSRRARQRTDEIEVLVLPAPRTYYSWNSWPGDYAGSIIAGADGAFHAFWISNESGRGELYTSRIVVQGRIEQKKTTNFASNSLLLVPPEGNLEQEEDSETKPVGYDYVLAMGSKPTESDNITPSLEFQCISSTWNPAAQTLSLRYRFLNTSSDILSGPVEMRITHLDSNLGVPTLVFDQAHGRAGTVLDLSHTIPREGLRAGQTSIPQKLIVKFDKVRQLSGADAKDVLHMKVMVYGVRRKAANDPR